MDKLFGSLKGLVKIPTVVTDNNVFRLHYKVTAPILVAFSLLVTSRQYIGDPIECISKDDVPIPVLNTFCWIHSTFSLDTAWLKKVGLEVPYPGIDTAISGGNKVYHAYYQWVCFVLFFQALLFYVPRYFWKVSEAGRMKHIVMELNCPVLNEEKRCDNRKLLVEYFIANFNHHNYYAACYLLSEVLNVVNVVGQMYLMDKFLGGTFSSYGYDVVKFTEWDFSLRYDPMIRVFPRMTKCTFHRFGSAGDVQKYDAMCILSINIINEKIYVFLWFWFVVLAVFSCFAVAYSLVTYLSPEARKRVLTAGVNLGKQDHLETVLRKCKFGDAFVIHLLQKNLHSLYFREFIHDIAERMTGKGANEI